MKFLLTGGVFLPLLFFAEMACAQAADPIKLALEPPSQSIAAGQRAGVTVVLEDADNRPAPASKEFAVTIEIHLPSGAVETRRLTLAAGQSARRLALRLRQSGIVKLNATEMELRPAEALIQVRPAARAAFEQTVTAPPALFLPSRHGARGMRFSETRLAATRLAAGPPPPQLTFLCSPDSPVLADGKDRATLSAFLDRPAPRDTVLTLFSSGGTLSRTQVTIPKGQAMASCALTCLRPGKVTVQLVEVTPQVTFDPAAGKALVVNFAAPIIDFALQSSPPSVSLIDQSYFVVQLLDEQKRPIAADTERKVCFAINNGNGQITPITLSIPPGSFQSQAVFLPDWLGSVQVTASMTNMLSKSARLQVNLPLLLLGVSLLGGLIGAELLI